MLTPKRLLLLAFTAWAAACSLVAPKFERPTVTVVSIELIKGSFLQQNFLVKMNVQNPNDRALPVTSVHADLSVAGERVASGVSSRAFVVPAQGATDFDMTITANMALALLKLSQRTDKHSGSIDYDMTGTARIDLPFVRDLPFHQNGSFSLRAPQ
jgi:LEA14-like dessication related protein